ncbi:CoA protein activase [Desulforamulus aeronauticus]|uniref:Predicted nucleotide-binding protein, sugar kinase/HSP70/actin superfamily n=1 Tax=Desulforamulus aeronauticus DSM 10349 TaxID=1121421 RepID=A0A1M6SVK0_9FIRM|nr:CoA protein activase [Desulforamulus aeronauticus]SHK48706.1 Predicted nucleotide-binding protein, sugar kinase/HSP70/actin superfamily [Desulforamulus aeronauticus DSM 10349]
MKVTFPHMGYMYVSLKGMLEYLGIDVVVPPPCSKRTLNLGVKHSPEFACLPLKLNIGNFIEARELGADTIMMAGGCGPCRFGYYAYVENEILKDLKIDYNLVVMEPPEKHIGELLGRIRKITGNRPWLQVIKALRFGFLKAKAVDEIENLSYQIRPRELVKGTTDRALEKSIDLVNEAATPTALTRALAQAKEVMAAVPADRGRPALKVALIGEIYTLLEPYSNVNIERHLGYLGVEVERAMMLSQWINDHLFMGVVRNLPSSDRFKKVASPYLNHFVGGHGEETVGSAVWYAQQGFAGAIQVLPFTCMPEIVAQSILPKVSENTGMPIMTLIMDEHSGEAGLITRLEAFIDLLQRKHEQKEALTS